MKQITKKLKAKLESQALEFLGTNGREGHSNHNSNISISLDIAYSDKNFALFVKKEGWCQYSRATGYYISRAALAIYNSDTKGISVVRIPASCESATGALEWLKPVEVRRVGKYKRQGDFYFIKSKKENFKALKYSRHSVHETEKELIIYHPRHKVLFLSKKQNWKAIQQKEGTASGKHD